MKKQVLTTKEMQLRIAQMKSEWPKYISYVGLYEEVYGKVTDEQKDKIRNFWNLRFIDETLLNKYEKLLEDHIR